VNPDLLHWIGLGAAALLSFFLSGMEAGAFALSRLRIRQQARRGRRQARLLLRYLERPENFLWTILVGNTAANFAIVVLLVADFRAWFADEPHWFWLSLLGLGAVVYLLCELLPKTLFQRLPNRLCLALVDVFRLVHFALSPVVAVVERFAGWLLRITGDPALSGRLFANRDELRALMQETGAGLSKTERTLINRVLDLEQLTVGRITRPLDTTDTVLADTPMTELLALCRENGHTRMPVWSDRGPRRRIVGIVSLKNLLYGEPDSRRPTARDWLRPALFLDQSMRLEQALRRLQRTGEHMAVVVGTDGREMGIVTLTDILRNVFLEGHA
jgi:putative hemolysin